MSGLDAFTEDDIQQYVAEDAARRVQEAAQDGYALEDELPPAATEEMPDGPFFSPSMDVPDYGTVTYAARTDASDRRMSWD